VCIFISIIISYWITFLPDFKCSRPYSILSPCWIANSCKFLPIIFSTINDQDHTSWKTLFLSLFPCSIIGSSGTKYIQLIGVLTITFQLKKYVVEHFFLVLFLAGILSVYLISKKLLFMNHYVFFESRTAMVDKQGCTFFIIVVYYIETIV